MLETRHPYVLMSCLQKRADIIFRLVIWTTLFRYQVLSFLVSRCESVMLNRLLRMLIYSCCLWLETESTSAFQGPSVGGPPRRTYCYRSVLDWGGIKGESVINY